MVGVCIPWSLAHVTTGRRDRRMWDEHVEFCERLTGILAGLPRPLIVAGDFNQSLPRTKQPERVFEILNTTLGGLTVATDQASTGVRLIDHVAVSPDLRAEVCAVWPIALEGIEIGDHTWSAAVDITAG